MTSLPFSLPYTTWHNHQHYTTNSTYTHYSTLPTIFTVSQTLYYCFGFKIQNNSRQRKTQKNHTQVIQQQSHACASKQSTALGTTLFIIPSDVIPGQSLEVKVMAKVTKPRSTLWHQGQSVPGLITAVQLVHFKWNIEMTMQANALLIGGRHASGENNSLPTWHVAGLPHSSLRRNTTVYCSVAYNIVLAGCR